MGELQRSAATKDAEAQKALLSAEICARQKAEEAMAEQQQKSKREQESLLAQIHELQDSQSRAEAQNNRWRVLWANLHFFVCVRLSSLFQRLHKVTNLRFFFKISLSFWSFLMQDQTQE